MFKRLVSSIAFLVAVNAYAQPILPNACSLPEIDFQENHEPILTRWSRYVKVNAGSEGTVCVAISPTDIVKDASCYRRDTHTDHQHSYKCVSNKDCFGQGSFESVFYQETSQGKQACVKFHNAGTPYIQDATLNLLGTHHTFHSRRR